MNKKEINYLVLSDIHLGHNTNKTKDIVNNLRTYFMENYKIFHKLDMIIIAGDIFDKLLLNNSENYILATEWLTELIMYCKKHNIILRILEGTPSHDWKQAKVLTTILEKLNVELDYKYIDTLYIEDNSKLGITILYIPDEYKHNAKDTYNDVLKLLKKNNLLEVDIAIIHGQFHYQLPMVKLDSSHTEDDYLNIVKHYISVGHIHTSSIYNRILAQGSFDRLAHNEEEDKGGMLITITNNGNDSYRFIKNKHSKIYKTFDYGDKDLEYILKDLDKKLNKYPIGSNIRILSNQYELLNKNMLEFSKRYKGYNFKLTKPKEEVIKVNLLDKKVNILCFPITRENIVYLLEVELAKHNFTQEEHNIFLTELEKCF